MRLAQALCVLTLAAGTLAAAPAGAKDRLDQFDIRAEPRPADWRYFIKAPEASRAKLWSYHAQHGVKLGGWAWGWRLGWVRACAKSDEDYCGAILKEALFDKALVVRAESATRLGQRYEGTRSDAVINMLAAAYRNEKNSRHGKPLYVQNRILYAIAQVGGGLAHEVGAKLAAPRAETKAYWAKLAAAMRAGG